MLIFYKNKCYLKVNLNDKADEKYMTDSSNNPLKRGRYDELECHEPLIKSKLDTFTDQKDVTREDDK